MSVERVAQRAYENPYKEGDRVVYQVCDTIYFCEVVAKGPNYLSLLDMSSKGYAVTPFRVYEKQIDVLRKI